MPRKKYHIKLSEVERQTLEALMRKGKASHFKRAIILLKVDEGCSNHK